jgi:hypothetical protein
MTRMHGPENTLPDGAVQRPTVRPPLPRTDGCGGCPCAPSVFGRKLQRELVRGVDTREECYSPHAWQRFKRTCVGSNVILECEFLPKNAHRALTDECAGKDSVVEEAALPLPAWDDSSRFVVLPK